MDTEEKRKSKPNVNYTLFLYREELQRTNKRYLELSNTKILLTDGLISKTARSVSRWRMRELKHLGREIIFKKKLKHQVKRLKKLQELGINNPNPNAMSTEL